MLTKLGESKPSEVIEKLRQEASFSSELLLTIVVRISLPAKNGHSQLEARIKRMSVDWPTITSLGTTQLYIPNRRPDRGDRKLLQVPIRYNPGSSSPGWPSMRSRSASISDKGRLEEEEVPSDKGRLEWELKSLPFHQPSEGGDAGGAGVSISESDVMMLHIGHPGELFKKEKLEVNAEVEIRGYLLSGLEARLFDATGRQQGAQPKLTTCLRIRTDLYPADVFARRTFSPYQQFVFDDIAPDEMRITDIVTVLRNSRFKVSEPWSAPENKTDTQSPKWLLKATRSQGPDDLDLLVAVEGKRHRMDREQIMAESMVKISGNKESGQLKVSMLGLLPRDHKELTREMNALQQALRDRFRFQQTSRG